MTDSEYSEFDYDVYEEEEELEDITAHDHEGLNREIDDLLSILNEAEEHGDADLWPILNEAEEHGDEDLWPILNEAEEHGDEDLLPIFNEAEEHGNEDMDGDLLSIFNEEHGDQGMDEDLLSIFNEVEQHEDEDLLSIFKEAEEHEGEDLQFSSSGTQEEYNDIEAEEVEIYDNGDDDSDEEDDDENQEEDWQSSYDDEYDFDGAELESRLRLERATVHLSSPSPTFPLAPQEVILPSVSFQRNASNSEVAQETTKERTDNLKVVIGNSPSEDKVLCNICFENKWPHELFHDTACSHRFCYDCIASYVQTKVSEKSLPVVCPGIGCSENLKPESCTAIIPEETLQKWSLALTDFLISERQKFYCPYKDCSALLVNDAVPEVGTSTSADVGAITQSECPECSRLFCARCRTPWHADLECSEVSKSATEMLNDRKFEDLIKREKWRKCPQCKRTVEKVSGCSHIICRCGHEFCYVCGSKWRSNSSIPCKCPAWMER